MRLNRRITQIVTVGIVMVALAGSADAGPITSYTVMGTGGTSGPIAGFSESSFSWIDYTGNVAATTPITDYGFNMTPGAPSYMQDRMASAFGSLLLSSPFTLNDTDVLNVSMTVLTGQMQAQTGQADVGFAVLLEDSALRAVLSNSRADGGSAVITWAAHPSGWDLTGPSAGVTTEITPFTSGLTELNLGSGNYGPTTAAGQCGFPCGIDVTSSYSPGSGTYQLLFGVFNMSGERDSTRPTGIAVTDVSVEQPVALQSFSASIEPVPEPSALTLLGFGLAALAASRGRRRAGGQ